MKTSTTIERNSNMELLRIVAMFSIILYHLLTFFVYPETEMPIYRALQIPFHIGVILFVLISGYYGIRTSLRGIIKLVLPLVFFYFAIEVAGLFIQGNMSGGGY